MSSFAKRPKAGPRLSMKVPRANQPPLGPRLREEGHLHRCRSQHRWFHAGPTAAACALPLDRNAADDGALLDATSCPLCSGRDDLLRRGLHVHDCALCRANWSHDAPCGEAPLACCPWCMPREGTSPSTASRGSHEHGCSRCYGFWRHLAPCVVPGMSEVLRCPLCLARRRHRTYLASGGLAAMLAGLVLL